jgi:hypothetical protein
MLVACSAYSFALKMDAVCFSEMLVNFYQTAQCHVAKDSTYLSTRLHDITSQKAVILIFTAVRTPNLKSSYVSRRW